MYDNYSTDNSRELIKNHPKADLINLFTWGRFSEKALTKSRNTGWKRSKGHADFVLVCDVDELLHHAEMISTLRQFQDEGVTIAKTRGLQMVSDQFPATNAPLIEQVKTGHEDHRFSKAVLFDPNAIEDMHFDYGSHECKPEGDIKWSEECLDLLHYSFLGFEEKWQRISQHAPRYGRSNRKYKLGVHYTWTKERLKEEFDVLLAKSAIII